MGESFKDPWDGLDFRIKTPRGRDIGVNPPPERCSQYFGRKHFVITLITVIAIPIIIVIAIGISSDKTPTAFENSQITTEEISHSLSN